MSKDKNKPQTIEDVAKHYSREDIILKTKEYCNSRIKNQLSLVTLHEFLKAELK
jgi:hypothetical protein